MEEMDVDEFLDIVMRLREDIKDLHKRVRKLEDESDIFDDIEDDPDWMNRPIRKHDNY
jgi:cell division septum initiation protein DivIVA